ncbi:cation:proton antiporter [Streptomyces niveiscabiei]|uniref:cation:proton antiporter domain-containing protein n=1 Tax=Streptomyces niveiscabiei TaxID=164115 RepID=UPI0029B8FF8C|nr:cation:proton antiporter [Streptomyces niveiscabiei]MDX3386253.1 cation:proton antiporter [Streptomyces niveiscabiei]
MTTAPARRAPGDARGRRGRLRLLLVVPVCVAPLVLAAVLLDAGSALPDRPGTAPAAGAEHAAAPLEVWRLLLALAVVVAAARLVGSAFAAWLRQPRVVGEMVSGILLGPSVLGLLAPAGYRALFPAGLLGYVDALAQVGLAMFMFLVGVELGAGHRGAPRAAGALVAVCGITLPFGLGVALARLMYGTLAGPGVGFLPFALFLGIVMSVTALPVLARILMERGMLHSRAGLLSVLGAAFADLVCWLLLAFVVTLHRGTSPAAVLRSLALTAVFFAGLVLVVRPLLRKVLVRQGRLLPEGALLSLVLVGALLSAVATDRIGVHPVFGALLFGAVCPADAPGLDTVRDRLRDVTTVVLLPPFFASVGLRTELGLLGGDPALWLWTGAALVVAVAGKTVGCAVAASAADVRGRDALRVGVLMNCRGLTELVVLGIGLELGLLTTPLFTVLVLVTLAATAMTTPLLDLLDRRR